MSRTRLVIATRKSALALAQARAFAAALQAQHPGLMLEEHLVTTTGDRIQDRALSQIGGKGLFIKEIEEALLSGDADIAVHSMKDVPAEIAASLRIGCVPLREDPRDVLVSRTGMQLSELPAGSRIGTSSLRRLVQLRAKRDDIEFVALRGNVDTRLKRCAEGAVDAVVLARAGLVRLGLAERASEILDVESSIPAIGQGALAIEQRESDGDVAELLRPLADPETTIAVAAERGVMLAVEGSCQIPVAAYARREGGKLRLTAFLAEPDGTRPRRRELTAEYPSDEREAERIGLDVGRELRG